MICSIDIVHERIDMADFSEKCVLFRDLPNRTVMERLKDALHDKYPGLDQHEHNFCKVDLQDSSACIALFKSQKDVERCIKDGVFHCEHEGQTVQLTPDLCSDCLIPEEWKNEMCYDFVTSMRTVCKGQSNATMMQVDDDDSFLSQDLFGSSKGHVSNPKLSASEQRCIPSKRFDSHEDKDFPSVIDAKKELPSTGKEEEILFRTSSYQTEPKEQAIRVVSIMDTTSDEDPASVPVLRSHCIQKTHNGGWLPKATGMSKKDRSLEPKGKTDDTWVIPVRTLHISADTRGSMVAVHQNYTCTREEYVKYQYVWLKFERERLNDIEKSLNQRLQPDLEVDLQLRMVTITSAKGDSSIDTNVVSKVMSTFFNTFHIDVSVYSYDIKSFRGKELINNIEMDNTFVDKSLVLFCLDVAEPDILISVHPASIQANVVKMITRHTFRLRPKTTNVHVEDSSVTADVLENLAIHSIISGSDLHTKLALNSDNEGNVVCCVQSYDPENDHEETVKAVKHFLGQVCYMDFNTLVHNGHAFNGQVMMYFKDFFDDRSLTPVCMVPDTKTGIVRVFGVEANTPKRCIQILVEQFIERRQPLDVDESCQMLSQNLLEQTGGRVSVCKDEETGLIYFTGIKKDVNKVKKEVRRQQRQETDSVDGAGPGLLGSFPIRPLQLVTSKRDKPDSQKLPEISAGSKVKVTSTDPTNQDTAEEEMSSCCIRVKGLPENITEDNLSLLFESKNAGGGTVTGVDIDKTRLEAVVEFEKASDVQRVLQMQETKPLKLSQCTLEIEEYQPPPQDQHKLFLSGIQVGTTEDCLFNFVEVTCKSRPSEMIWGGQPGTALLLFEEPQDVKILREKCQSRQLENQLLCATVIPVNNCVKLEGLSERTTTDSVTYFFESRRGGNRDVDRVELRADSKCLIFFRRHEDAISLVEEGEPINIENSTVAVSFFYDFMEGSASNEHRGNVGNKRNMGGADFTKTSIPQPFQLDISKQLVRFLENAKTYRDGFETKMTEKKAVVIWPTQNGSPLVLECLSPRELEVAYVSIATWETDCREAVADFMSRLCEENVQVTKEVWESVRKRVSEISFSHPDAVALSINSRALSWTIVGQKQLVSTLKVQIETIVSDEETRSIAESQEITKKRTLKNYQIILLNLSSLYVKEVEDSGVSVLVDKREIVFSGRKNDVDKALSKLEKLFESFQYKSKCVTLQCKELLFCKETQDYLKRQFRDHKVIGVWDMIPQSDGFIMHVYSRKEQDAATAFGIIERSLVEKALPLDESMSKLIRDKDGYSMLQELSVRFDGSLMFHVKPDSLYYITTDLKEKKVTAEIQSFFDRHSIVSEFIKLSTGVLRYLQEHLRHIETQYQVLDVTIKVIDNPVQPGIRVTGKRDGCHMAVRKIQELKGSVLHEEYKVKGPDVTDFSSNSKVYDEMRYLEMEHKCVLEVDTTDNSSSNSGPSSAEKSGEKSPRRRQISSATGATISISVITGELAKQQADVLVNSTNQNLDLVVGTISKSLLKIGGSSIQQDCKANYPIGIRPGQVAVSVAGQLKCHQVFHGCLVCWDQGKGTAKKVMRTFIDGCLDEADRQKFSSLSFPALGTGILKFPVDIVARLMFDCVEAFGSANAGTSLQQVNFVVYPSDLAAVKAFQHEENRRSITSGSGWSSSPTRLNRRTSAFAEIAAPSGQSSHYEFNIGGLRIEVCQGDLTNETSHVIVNSVQSDLDLSQGAVSQAILKKAGRSVQEECFKHQNVTRMDKDRLITTGPGRLPCQHIIHAKARSKASNWETTVGKCLEEAEKLGVSSIAFPALGTGGKGCAPEEVAKAMFNAIKQFAKSKTIVCLKTVRILIFQKEMVDQFVTAATDGNPGFFGAEKDLLKISPKEGSRSEVRIHVYFGSRHSFSQIRRNLDQICIMEKVEKIMHPSISLMKDITKEQEIFFQDIGRKRNVMVEMSAHSPYRYITLQGAEKDVLTIEEALGRCFQQMEKEQLQSGGTAVRLPKNWSKRTLMDSVRAVPLSGMDQEYIDVSAKLRASGYVTIRLIERIQNPTLYTQYIAKKHEMERSCITKPIERYLWHGTSGTAVRNIVNTGFNRSYNSGGSLGCGVYFAVNPATSISGYCLPDVAGQKHIFFTKVLTGDFCLGSGGIKVPPRKNPRNSDSMAIFDSTTDNQAAPNLFAIFHDAQAYPGYHITFT